MRHVVQSAPPHRTVGQGQPGCASYQMEGPPSMAGLHALLGLTLGPWSFDPLVGGSDLRTFRVSAGLSHPPIEGEASPFGGLGEVAEGITRGSSPGPHKAQGDPLITYVYNLRFLPLTRPVHRQSGAFPLA